MTLPVPSTLTKGFAFRMKEKDPYSQQGHLDTTTKEQGKFLPGLPCKIKTIIKDHKGSCMINVS